MRKSGGHIMWGSQVGTSCGGVRWAHHVGRSGRHIMWGSQVGTSCGGLRLELLEYMYKEKCEVYIFFFLIGTLVSVLRLRSLNFFLMYLGFLLNLWLCFMIWGIVLKPLCARNIEQPGSTDQIDNKPKTHETESQFCYMYDTSTRGNSLNGCNFIAFNSLFNILVPNSSTVNCSPGLIVICTCKSNHEGGGGLIVCRG